MGFWRWSAGLVLVAAAVIWSCGKGTDNNQGSGGNVITPPADDGGGIQPPPPPPPPPPLPDGGVDGGTAWTPPPPVDFPNPPPAGWSFYGPQNGGPHDVFGVSADQAGNIWVAGGEDGLFLMRAGSTTFQRFTMDDGLRPFGYMPDGSDPIGPKFLKVISVAGGPANTVFVGYEGRNRGVKDDCEGNWDNPNPALVDPSIYKSGDADRVTVDAAGKLSVVHYDIFSGPNVVSAEPRGREKICHILRIVWDPKRNDVWFGGNHGFVLGDAAYPGDPKCNGQINCSGVAEHAHPAFDGIGANGGENFITGDYRGVAVDPSSGDVWFGGINRTTKLHYGGVSAQFPNASRWARFVTADIYTEGEPQKWPPPACPYSPCYGANRIDVWQDAAGEVSCNASGSCVPHVPTLAEQTPADLVFAIAALPDGGAWIGSGYLGLRRLNANGVVVEDATARMLVKDVGGLAYDPNDGSLWVGHRFAGGVERLNGPAGDQRFSLQTFGGDIANMPIGDVQLTTAGGGRKVLFGFLHGAKFAGFVAVYSGN